ncbi:MAG: DNA lyase [Elusimicrobia bacterium HGW-Elusimicrobia-2]|nr:MAG: DNA lyase [Elusimicrobia bacterium HGW-Elusimicrobia-2]
MTLRSQVNTLRPAKIKILWRGVRSELLKALESFRRTGESGSKEKIFSEMVYCLLTPQSKAVYCWAAVGELKNKGLLFKGGEEDIAAELRKVRFPNNKSLYILEARSKLPGIMHFLKQENNPLELRKRLIKDIKGYGFKEASHFLRNIGKGEHLAILDRHILRNLKTFGVIEEIPESINEKKYFEIEKIFMLLAKDLNIPPAELDLLLWYKETGKIFK